MALTFLLVNFLQAGTMFFGRELGNDELTPLHEADDLKNAFADMAIHWNIILGPRATYNKTAKTRIEHASLFEFDEEFFKRQAMRGQDQTARARFRMERNRCATYLTICFRADF